MKNLCPLLLVLAFITVLAACSKDESLPEVTDPKEAILGRWELIENSFGPIENPIRVDEYLPDSILQIYYTEESPYICKYWFKDSILYTGGEVTYLSNDTIIYDTIIHEEPYSYRFLNYNKLRLDFQYPAVNTKYIYKRMK